MVAGYCAQGMADKVASFELFVRRLPADFGYLVAMGLEQVLQYLSQLRFDRDRLDQVRATGLFDHAPADFWTLLANGRFTGDVWAVAEGSIVLAHEPILRIEAPLWQAQWVETYLLNVINYQTLIATRAARSRQAAGPDATLLEFGTRRAFSPQAALWAARASLAAGLDATSNVLAALELGVRPSGTMAHAWVMAGLALDRTELDTFRAFHETFPEAALLVDTIDPVAALRQLGDQVRAGTIQVPAVRLDSGDLVALSQLAKAELPGVRVLASGDLDERAIEHLRAAGARIDGYGLGTKLVTGEPVNGVYKLVELADRPVMKQADGKITYPGRKQIFRGPQGDRLGLADEAPGPNETAALACVMRQGQRLQPPESLGTIAQRSQASVAALPEAARRLTSPIAAIAEVSPALRDLTAQTQRALA